MAVLVADPASALYAQQAQVLSTCLAALGEDAPPLAYVSPGPPVLNLSAGGCRGALTVHLLGPMLAPYAPAGTGAYSRDHKAAWRDLASYVVTVARCLSETGAPLPRADLLSADAERSSRDVWRIWLGLHYAQRRGELFDPDGEFTLLGCAPLNPSGGVYGWTVSLQAAVAGYDPFAV